MRRSTIGVLLGLAAVGQAQAGASGAVLSVIGGPVKQHSLVQRIAVSPPYSSMLWLVVSSRPTYGEAEAIAQSFAYTLGPSAIVQTRNGLYAVVAGTLYQDKAKSNLSTLKALRLIPEDSFLSAGTNFYQIISHSYGQKASTDLMTQSTYLQTVRRMQSALKQMSLYNAIPDGLIGPGTVKSFDAYLSAYTGPTGDFLNGNDLAVMESNAQDGFRSQADRQIARSRGFESASSYAEASRGGFTSADVFDKARGLGFTTQQEYQAAQSSGFKDAAEYQRARSGGFTSAYEFYVAQRAGLANQAEYVAFRSSGFSDAAAYRAARAGGFSDKRSFDEASSAGFKSQDEFEHAKAAGFRSAYDFRAAEELGLTKQGEYSAFKASGFADVSTYRTAKEKGFTDKASFDKAMAAELAAMQINARTLLADADTFLRLNPTAPNLIEIADKAAGLSATLPSGSTDALRQASSKLTSLLVSVPGYSNFSAKRDKERAEELATRTAEIKKQLEARRDQLTRWVAANIASPKLPEVVGELKLLSDAADFDSVETLASAVDTIEALIVRQNLAVELEKLNAPTTAAGPVQLSRSSTATPFEVTLANEVLLRGPLDGIVVLQNAGPTAPSLMRTLNGEYSFTDGVATICTLGVEGTPSLARGLTEALRPMGAAQLIIASEACGARSIQSADLLLISRKRFLEADTGLASAFLDAMKAGGLKPFPAIDFTRVQAKQKEEDALSAAIAVDLKNGTRMGYGAMQFPVADGTICAFIDGQIEAHSAFVSQSAAFVGMVADPLSIKTGSLDAIYQDLRRDRCKVFYASAGALGQVAQAFARDGRGFSFLPVWFDSKMVADASTSLASEEAEEVKKAEAARLAIQAEAQAAERRQREEAEKRSIRQAAMRQEIGAAATAAMNMFADGLKLAMLGAPQGSTHGQAGSPLAIEALFPGFAVWKAGMQRDAWRPLTVDTTVSDYGSVDWKGRTLEAVVVEAHVKLSNSERGEYRQECFLLGAVIDGEFNTMRDPIETRCDDAASLSPWKAGHGFDSRWVADAGDTARAASSEPLHETRAVAADQRALEQQVAMLLNAQERHKADRTSPGEELKILTGQLASCWNIPAGMEVGGYRALIRFDLDASGKLDGRPMVDMSSGNPVFDQSAIRAVQKCDRDGLMVPRGAETSRNDFVVTFDVGSMF